jgi:ABC-type Mn2+/Zn2+ transport system permease subunit
MAILSLLTDPFAYGFFTRALLACLVIGGMCGAISVFVVLRRMSYIGHGLAHSVLGGVAVAVALGYSTHAGAIAATLVSALLIDRVSRRRGLHADAAIGIVTTGLFAMGIAVVSTMESQRVSTESILFGNVLGVTATDLWFATAVAAGFAAILFVWYKPLVFVAFDPTVARVHGVRAGLMEALFNLLTAAVVIVSVRVLGVLLVAAAVVIPGAFARLLTRSFGTMLGVATAAGVASGVLGLYGSYYVNVPSGATIVLVGTAIFGLGFVVSAVATRTRLRRARVTAAGSGSPADALAETAPDPYAYRK